MQSGKGDVWRRVRVLPPGRVPTAMSCCCLDRRLLAMNLDSAAASALCDAALSPDAGETALISGAIVLLFVEPKDCCEL